MAQVGLTVPQTLNHGIPLRVVTAASATGVALAQSFVLPVDGGTYSNFLMAQAVRTNTTDLSALTATLQSSLDGGVTFNDVAAASNFVTVNPKFEIVAGPIYRISIASITTANAATCDFWVCIG